MNTLKNLSDIELKQYYELYQRGMNKTKRFEAQKIYNTDLKFLYHLVRLLNEVEQILLEGDLDLERNREQLKDIRRGKWKQSEIEEYFQIKEKDLESLYLKSELPHTPQWDEIRNLLNKCLEIHFADKKLIIEPTEKLLKALWSDLTNLSIKYQGKVNYD
jgi:hypothetical protein